MTASLDSLGVTFNLLEGLEFTPSPELRAIKGLTWANDFRHYWYVAIQDRRVIGCVGLLIRGGSARYKTDAVLPEARGKGVYRALYALRASLAASKGCSEATTFSNQNSRPMYLKDGFQAAGEESDSGVLFMRKIFDKRVKSW